MSHGHDVELGQMDAQTAASVAATMQALATPSRVRILSCLSVGACSVNELVDEIGMSQPAISQQLRVLRYLGLVVGNREGRHVRYSLHDDHVRALLTEAVGHSEHIRLGLNSQATVAIEHAA